MRAIPIGMSESQSYGGEATARHAHDPSSLGSCLSPVASHEKITELEMEISMGTCCGWVRRTARDSFITSMASPLVCRGPRVLVLRLTLEYIFVRIMSCVRAALGRERKGTVALASDRSRAKLCAFRAAAHGADALVQNAHCGRAGPLCLCSFPYLVFPCH